MCTVAHVVPHTGTQASVESRVRGHMQDLNEELIVHGAIQWGTEEGWSNAGEDDLSVGHSQHSLPLART